MGAHKRGGENIGQKFLVENGAFSGLIGSFSGPIGAFWAKPPFAKPPVPEINSVIFWLMPPTHLLEMRAVALLELRLWWPALQCLAGKLKFSKFISSHALQDFMLKKQKN